MKRGFTLIELLIVIIILGILATIAVPQFEKLMERSRISEAVTNIGAIRHSWQRWYLDYEGEFVPNLALANITQINEYLDCDIKGRYWGYSANGGPTDYTITATRLAAGGGPYAGKTIYIDETGTYGDPATDPNVHPLSPKN